MRLADWVISEKKRVAPSTEVDEVDDTMMKSTTASIQTMIYSIAYTQFNYADNMYVEILMNLLW